MKTTVSFTHIAMTCARLLGTPVAFLLAVAATVGWLALGPYFHWSDGWQLWINTTTTIITFLMVILVQATQNHDSRALHLKLDELLRAIGEARNQFVGIQDASDVKINALEMEFQDIAAKAAAAKKRVKK